ncbi:hypothetical protein Bca52824_030753 [Brassica carinata]|uniref:PB1 domain-containing protein n=1 Tax=Brassica carinata TaxID=52824 RepID=A0A8X7V4P8_BRACI|nr:hypothetical protein Bca52824_030753 [Brassica carinata]
MEPPPPSSTAVASTVVPAVTSSIPPHVPSSYPESLDSSPKSRTTDAWDDLPPPAATSKLRLMCSYNGHILPRPHDKSLCYMGGDTRIVVVDRNSSLSSLVTRLSNTLLNGQRSFTLKYQLPTEDLDSLISVTTDEDLDNMIEEYDRTMGSNKPSRLRLFLFAAKKPDEATQSMGQILESSAKSDDWFLDALNRGFSKSGDKDNDGKQLQQLNLPDSPMLDTSSSFGSTSSSPSLANLPPIRVHVEEGGGVKGVHDQKLGIEEQFARFNVESKIRDEGFAAISSPPPPMPVTISLPAAPVKPPTPHSQHQQPHNLPTQQGHQVKSNSGGHEMPSPDSVSSDSSMNNSVFHQRPVSQMPSGSTGLINHSDPNTLLSHNPNQNQNQDSGYILHPAQSQPQQQQFIHAAAAPQYLHHHPSTGLPVQSYIQVYPSQPQQQQSYPFYYATAPVPPKPYNMPVTQSVSDSLAMMAPPANSHLRNTPGGKPEAGVYTTTQQGMGGAQIVHQVPVSQQQFMGYSQIHHQPQSGSAGIPNYGYEYAENAPKQVYYTQHIGHAQYQTMTGPSPSMVLPDGSAAAKLPAENMTQQIRSSQPL